MSVSTGRCLVGRSDSLCVTRWISALCRWRPAPTHPCKHQSIAHGTTPFHSDSLSFPFPCNIHIHIRIIMSHSLQYLYSYTLYHRPLQKPPWFNYLCICLSPHNLLSLFSLLITRPPFTTLYTTVHYRNNHSLSFATYKYTYIFLSLTLSPLTTPPPYTLYHPLIHDRDHHGSIICQNKKSRFCLSSMVLYWSQNAVESSISGWSKETINLNTGTTT